jgi:peptidoglycan/LPS O-acetylase OafA/YrhL
MFEESTKTLIESNYELKNNGDNFIDSFVTKSSKQNSEDEVSGQNQNKHQNSKKLKYRAELDGLRAIAVTSVVFYHAGFKLFKGGYVGVDVFFVLSGFLMSSIILRENEAGKFTLRAFYERRARRILPMLMLTLIISYIPAYLLLTRDELRFFIKSSFYSSIAGSNIFYSKTTRGYFDTSSDLIPLIHTWTLGVEEQFYVIIPLIFIIFWRLGKYFVCSIIATIAIVSFCLTRFYAFNSIQRFYLLYTRYL